MTAILNVFPNKFDLSIFEKNEIAVGITFIDYLKENVPAYFNNEITQELFTVELNGSYFDKNDWGTYVIQNSDVLNATVEAKAPVTIAYAVIAIVAVGAAIYANNIDIPDNYNKTVTDGSTIYRNNVQGNQARLMGIRPELAGTHNIYPDWLNMPRYEFIDNEEWIFLFYGVTNGECEILAGNLYIGETPLNRYAGDHDISIFGPGENVSTHEAHRNIYTSSEVSNIELEGPAASSASTDSNYRWTFEGKTLSRFYLGNSQGGTNPYPISFPYSPDDVITINANGTVNDGDFKVVSISGRVATLQRLDGSGNNDSSWTSFTDDSIATAEIEVQGADGDYHGGYYACPEEETTNKIFLDFIFPQGLGELNDDSEFISKTVQIEIQYKDINSSSWTSVYRSFTNATNDQLAETLEINTSSKITPEVRIRRVTPQPDNTRVYDTLQWVRLKSELETVTSYEDLTTIGLKIKSSNSLSSNAETKFNVTATRKLPVYENGNWSDAKATNDIIPFFSHIIKDVGHTDAQLDFDVMTTLHNKWKTRGDEFNAVFDSASTLFESLKRVLAVGFAEPTLDFGQIIPVRDEPRTVFDYMYQPENMLKGGLQRDINLIDDDEPDGVEVEYFSSETWKSETILCLLPEDSGQNPKNVRAFGITDKTNAWRFGMRKRREIRYRRTTYSFKTEMDALNSKYLSYDALADNIPGYSQTGEVLSVKGTLITVSEPLTFGTGIHYMAIRKPNGTLSGLYTVSKTDDDYSVILNKTLDFTPVLNSSHEPPFFMFGEATKWCYPTLTKEIKPSGTDEVSVKSVNYDERVYADDDNFPT